jgi:hypothetical protein
MQFKVKNKSIYIITMLCAMAMLTINSCKKLIEIEAPHATITSDAVFQSNTSAASALAGVYATFTAPCLYAGLSSDELIGYAGITNVNDYQLSTNTVLVGNGTTDTFIWAPLYKSVYYSNSILDGVAASTSTLLTDSARRQLNGEAKFLRAFNFFTLTNYFGDIPLPLVTDFHQTTLLPRVPQAKVYEQIIKDLTDAQTLLPGDYNVAKGERIRANKWAATALLARVYLYQQNWAAAETQSSAIISNTSQYGLVTPLSTVFNKNTNEAIFQLKPSAAFQPYGILEESYFLSLLPWSSVTPADQATLFALWSIYGAYFTPAYYFTPQQVAAFETNDQRKTSWVLSTPSPPAAPYNGVVTYYPAKYTQPLTPNATTFAQYQMVLRVAEQYLIRAEARAQQNNLPGAADDINVIRARAGLPATTAITQIDLLTAVAQERRVELFAEGGHRWFDLKRTGKAAAVLAAITSKQPFNSNQLLYPIPSSEIRTDPNLIQNPGY